MYRTAKTRLDSSSRMSWRMIGISVKPFYTKENGQETSKKRPCTSDGAGGAANTFVG